MLQSSKQPAFFFFFWLFIGGKSVFPCCETDFIYPADEYEWLFSADVKMTKYVKGPWASRQKVVETQRAVESLTLAKTVKLTRSRLTMTQLSYSL